MARQLPIEIVRAMNAPETGVVVLALLRIAHGNNTLQIVNNTQAISRTADGQWNPYPFSIVLPNDGHNEIPVLDVTAANVDLQVTEFAKRVVGQDTHALCDLLIVDAANPNTTFLTYMKYEVRNLRYDVNTISFELKLHTTLEEAFYKWVFRPSIFPTIF